MPFSIRRTVKVAGKGSVVVPLTWSDNAATILLTKYCRSYNGLIKETSAMEVFERLTDFWLEIKKGELPSYWYASPGDDPKAELAERFKLKTELLKLLVEQKAAPNSPQFFNAGINNSMTSWEAISVSIIGTSWELFPRNTPITTHSFMPVSYNPSKTAFLV